MIKIAYLSITLLLTAAVHLVQAQDKVTPTDADSSDKTKQIQELQDRLATKVAELRQTKPMAVFGITKNISVASMTIETLSKTIKLELPDEIKIYQYLKGKRTKLTTDDLDSGDLVTVFGTYDQTIDVLKAAVIHIQEENPVHIGGFVKTVDKKSYSIYLTSLEDQPVTIDYETGTKTSLYTKDNGAEKAGFSKINPNDFVIVTGTAVPNKDGRYSASRILNMGQLKPQESSPSAEVTPTASPAPVKNTSTPKVTPGT